MVICVKLLLVTAQRRSEVVGIRKSELNLPARVWLLPEERAKSGRRHLIPLSSLALELIAEADRLSGHSELLFPARHRLRQPLGGDSVGEAVRRAGLPVQGWTLHDLRRTAATHMRGLDPPVDRLTVSKILNGHSLPADDPTLSAKSSRFADGRRRTVPTRTAVINTHPEWC